MKTLAALISLLFCVAAKAEQTQAIFKYGERLNNTVFDPTGVLTSKEQKLISEPLVTILKNEGIDIIVVILQDIGDAPPEHVAKRIAEQWATTTINSVVLHVPGKEGSPWIFPGTVMTSGLDPDEVKRTIVAAEKRAAAEPTEFGKVRAASIEAADAIRYWMGGAMIQTENLINRRLEWQFSVERRKRMLQLYAAIGAAAAIPILAGLLYLIIRIRSSGERKFPPIRKLTRLGAPYSGGNSACSKPI